MRSLKTIVRLAMFLTLLGAITVLVVVPGSWLYIASTLPNGLESASDLELHLRQSIESDRQSVQLQKPAKEREPVTWPRPDFSKLPTQLIALYITTTGCASYFETPKETGWTWNRRLLAAARRQHLKGNGACELIFAGNIAWRIEARSPMDNLVAADRVHRFLTKDELVAFDLSTMWFGKGIIGVEKASEVLMHKPLHSLSLAELAELQVALPPFDYWKEVYMCTRPAVIKSSRDKVLQRLADVGHIDASVARAELAKPLRCPNVHR